MHTQFFEATRGLFSYQSNLWFSESVFVGIAVQLYQSVCVLWLSCVFHLWSSCIRVCACVSGMQGESGDLGMIGFTGFPGPKVSQRL